MSKLFDTHAFLTDHWPRAGALSALLSAYGYPCSYHRAIRWYQRDNIPGAWALLLVGLIEIETGAPMSVVKYMRPLP